MKEICLLYLIWIQKWTKTYQFLSKYHFNMFLLYKLATYEVPSSGIDFLRFISRRFLPARLSTFFCVCESAAKNMRHNTRADETKTYA